jgi:hypothetical protein
MTPDDMAAAMIPVACELACLVRDGDQAGIARRMYSLLRQDPQDDGMRRLYALVVVLAAMVPDDQPLPELLAWPQERTPQRDAMLVKAHNRAVMRQNRGLPLWGPLARLEAEYHRRAREKRILAAAGEAAAA